jgi:hypothetical protein
MAVEERIDEKTPNGGQYAIAYFQDKDGNPVDKGKAVQAEIVEFDANDQPIWRTYGTIGGYEPSQREGMSEFDDLTVPE